MISTAKNLADSEMNLGHKWVIAAQLDSDVNANVQLGSETGSNLKLESDPICSSAGCTQYKHKHKKLGYDIDYFVPHFGTDQEINDNFEDLKVAEKIQGHKLDFWGNGKWKNPAKKTLYNI